MGKKRLIIGSSPSPFGSGLHIQLVCGLQVKSSLRWLLSIVCWQSEQLQIAFHIVCQQSVHSLSAQPLGKIGKLVKKWLWFLNVHTGTVCMCVLSLRENNSFTATWCPFILKHWYPAFLYKNPTNVTYIKSIKSHTHTYNPEVARYSVMYLIC